MSPPLPCTTANLPVLCVILDPPPKFHYQQLKNNSGCLSHCYHHRPLHDGSPTFICLQLYECKATSRLLCFVNSRPNNKACIFSQAPLRSSFAPIAFLLAKATLLLATASLS
jgi:hypothetical protein